MLLAPKEPIELSGNGEEGLGFGGSDHPDQTKLDLGGGGMNRGDLDGSIDEGGSGEELGGMMEDDDDEDGVKCIKCEKSFQDIFRYAVIKIYLSYVGK